MLGDGWGAVGLAIADGDAAFTGGLQVDVVDAGGRDEDQLEFRAGGEGLRIQGHLVDDGNLRAAQALDDLFRRAQVVADQLVEGAAQRGEVEVALVERGEVEENGAIGHQLYLSKSPGLVDNANLGLGVESGLCTGWNL